MFDIANLIDKRWRCKVAYVYPTRNRVARFLARPGKRVCDGGVEELLDWDMGWGIDDPGYQG